MVILKRQDLFLLIEKIYAAGLDPKLWQDCVNEIQNVLNGRVGFFYTYDASTQETTDFFLLLITTPYGSKSFQIIMPTSTLTQNPFMNWRQQAFRSMMKWYYLEKKPIRLNIIMTG